VSHAAAPEFSRPWDIRKLGETDLRLVADDVELGALARRFGVQAIRSLIAEVTLASEAGTFVARGRMTAEVEQSCAVSGEPLKTRIDEELDLRFVPATAHDSPDEEIELEAGDCDEIEFTGGTIDLGEALAQSLGLAIDPYATGPDAEAVRAAHGLLDEERSGPFAGLAALKR
jgi:uncharacterized metal-binding protein YceD (DUF177 family)